MTARKLVAPAPDPAGPTPFADTALDLRDHGLAPIPLGGDDGKVPLVTWARWKHPPGRQFLERLTEEHPTANVGVLTGLSGVTVVDIDDPDLTDDMVWRFGDTPLKTSTPSDGVHLWFRSSGERNRQRLDGLAVDLRGEGGMVVVPPSIRPTGQHAGKAYTFLSGSWDDLRQLPVLKPGSLHDGRVVYEGSRGDTLFKFLLRQVRACDTPDDLMDVARTFNADSCLPPLTDSMVIKTARSAWQYENETDRENWVGGPARVVFTADDVDRLVADADAFAFLAKLKVAHGGRLEPFALDARAMNRTDFIPGWGRNRYMAVTERLVISGDVDRIYKGGKRPGDHSLYLLPRAVPKQDPI